MPEPLQIPDARPLAAHERQFVERLLRECTLDPAPWLDQLSIATVVSRCGCGCPSLDLAVAAQPAPTSSRNTILAEAEGISPEGVQCGIILHAREGRLSELEVYPFMGATAFSLPPVGDLKFYTPPK